MTIEEHVAESEKEWWGMTLEEINRIKFMICCPMCDNKKCVRNTDKCEAEIWAKERRKKNEGLEGR